MRATPRHRRVIGHRSARLVTPMFRYSYSRDAYVLRGVGNRMRPVLRIQQNAATHQAKPAG